MLGNIFNISKDVKAEIGLLKSDNSVPNGVLSTFLKE